MVEFFMKTMSYLRQIIFLLSVVISPTSIWADNPSNSNQEWDIVNTFPKHINEAHNFLLQKKYDEAMQAYRSGKTDAFFNEFGTNEMVETFSQNELVSAASTSQGRDFLDRLYSDLITTSDRYSHKNSRCSFNLARIIHAKRENLGFSLERLSQEISLWKATSAYFEFGPATVVMGLSVEELDSIPKSSEGRRFVDSLYLDAVRSAVKYGLTTYPMRPISMGRIIQSKMRALVSPEKYSEQTDDNNAKVFPFNPTRAFDLGSGANIPLVAKPNGDGTVHVMYPLEIHPPTNLEDPSTTHYTSPCEEKEYSSDFIQLKHFYPKICEQVEAGFGDGIDLPENQVIGIRTGRGDAKVHYTLPLELVYASEKASAVGTSNIVELVSLATIPIFWVIGGEFIAALRLANASPFMEALAYVDQAVLGLGGALTLVDAQREWMLKNSRYGEETVRRYFEISDKLSMAISVYSIARLIGTPIYLEYTKSLNALEMLAQGENGPLSSQLSKLKKSFSGKIRPMELEIGVAEYYNSDRAHSLGTQPKYRLRPIYNEHEGEVGALIEKRFGGFKRDPSTAGEWISQSGPFKEKVFDLAGLASKGVPHQDPNMREFLASIDRHFLKSVDYVVLDVRYMTPLQREIVLSNVLTRWIEKLDHLIILRYPQKLDSGLRWFFLPQQMGERAGKTTEDEKPN